MTRAARGSLSVATKLVGPSYEVRNAISNPSLLSQARTTFPDGGHVRLAGAKALIIDTLVEKGYPSANEPFPEMRQMSARSPAVIALAALLVAAILYAPVAEFPFLYDDNKQILANENIQGWHGFARAFSVPPLELRRVERRGPAIIDRSIRSGLPSTGFCSATSRLDGICCACSSMPWW